MSDLISKRAVLDELEKWDWQDLYLPIHFKQILDDVPSVENKGDLISRQVVLELLQMKYFGKDLYKAIYELPSANAISIDQANAMIKSYVSHYEENKAEWIPVSEMLPEDYDRVLITVNGWCGLIVREAQYYKAKNEFKVLHNHERWEVGEKGLLAWQPLPEPYKGENEEI